MTALCGTLALLAGLASLAYVSRRLQADRIAANLADHRVHELVEGPLP